MDAVLLLWVGLTLILAVPPILGAFEARGGNISVYVGAACMVVGCVLLVLGR